MVSDIQDGDTPILMAGTILIMGLDGIVGDGTIGV